MCKERSHKNVAVVACAGGGKTWGVVSEALKHAARVLITTYTDENTDQIRSYIIQQVGCVPCNIDVISWYRFLLRHGVRPYQNLVFSRPRTRSILFKDAPYGVFKRTEMKYFFAGEYVYRNRLSDFACLVDERTDGLVVSRMTRIYSHIFIDEMQDLAGYDLELIIRLFRSKASVTLVGDPRQATFSTNNSGKNRTFRRSGIFDWLNEQKRRNLCTIEESCTCHRGNQKICDFGDALFPHLPSTKSENNTATDMMAYSS
jgi:DNA helicase-2/ATP-dependent DNA helicase PcrA